jgi:DNA ligase-associated metallophosphoesterase
VNDRTGARASGGGVPVTIRGEALVLLPGRAVHWPARRTLVIADAHFGKDDVFRRAGIALPRGPAIADLQRLTQLVDATSAGRLVVLGDFLHGATARGDAFLHAFALWRRSHRALAVQVVAGNHDRREQTAKWEGLVEWLAPPVVELPFAFAHEPSAHESAYVLAGHVHPVAVLGRGGRFATRVPVFWLRADCLILPSWGSLTGGMRVEPASGDRLYAAAPEKVIPLASAVARP